jgi:hypothetical protein
MGGVCVPDTVFDGGLPDAGFDAGADAGVDASADASVDAGLPAITISTVDPNISRSGGEDFITIVGSGFDADASVFFDQSPGLGFVFLGPTTVKVTTPAHAFGPTIVRVFSPTLDASATASFTYYDPVEVIDLSPDAGRLDAGEQVTIHGAGFVADSGVWFGDAPAEVVSIDTLTGASLVVVPPQGMLPYEAQHVRVANVFGDETKQAAFLPYAVISTYAGGGSGSGASATQVSLSGIVFGATDSQGRAYISATDSHRIWRLDLDGKLTHIAGTGERASGPDGPATETAMMSPRGLAFSSAGELYVAEYGGSKIRKLSNGMLVTVAGTGLDASTGDDGPALGAAVNTPTGIAFDTKGRLLITETLSHVVRRIDFDSGVISRVAGTRDAGRENDAGNATATNINSPFGITEWPIGSNGFVFAEYGNALVRAVNSDGGTWIIAGDADAGDSGVMGGDGQASLPASTPLPEIACITPGPSGRLYFSQLGISSLSSRNRVLMYSPLGTLAPYAGNGDGGTSADGVPATTNPLTNPCVFAAADGGVYITEGVTRGSRVRIVDGGLLYTVAGSGTDGANYFGDNGPATNAGLSAPYGLAYDLDSGVLFIADRNNNRIRAVSPNGSVSTVAGNGDAGYSGENGPATSASLRALGVAVLSDGALRISDTANNRIRGVGLDQTIFWIAGNGSSGTPSDSASTNSYVTRPHGIAMGPDGKLYFVDYSYHVVRRIEPLQNQIERVAGIPGVAGYNGDGISASAAQLWDPLDVAFDLEGNLLIADYRNNRIRRVRDGGIETVIGNGNASTTGDDGPAFDASVNMPTGICVSPKNHIVVTERYGYVVRRIWRNADGVEIARVIAGRPGIATYSGENTFAHVATLSSPTDVACAPDNVVYVSDSDVNRIRVIK